VSRSTNNRWHLPRIYLTNVRSLRYKVDELTAVLETNNIEIGCITESWLDENIATDSIDITNYTCYRHDRADGRRGGGVVCYINNQWPCTRLQSLETPESESVWLLLRRPVMPRQVSHIAIGAIYHPPGAPSGAMVHHIISAVDTIISQHPHAGVVIVGDFNTLDDRSIRSYPLKQVVHVPTRGHATLDKIYTNIENWYKVPHTIPSIASADHYGVLLLPQTEVTLEPNRQFITTRCISSNSQSLLAHALLNFDWAVLDSISDASTKVEYFNSCITTLLNFFLPVQIVERRQTDKPWVNDKFRRLIRCRQHAWTSGDRSTYNKLRNQVNQLSKRLRNQFYHRRIEGLRSSNPHDWWRRTKQLVGQQVKPQLQSLINDTASGDVQLLADLINNALLHVSIDLAPLSDVSLLETTDIPSEYIFQSEEVYNLLLHVKTHKSPGPDEIPNWFLKEFAFAIADPVCHIFNASFSSGSVPDIWKRANVIPIPKANPPKSICDDLRPISLTATLSKLLESLIGRRLLPKIVDKLDSKQFGALRGRSTTHALTAITHMWHQALDDRMSVRALFVDYSKAFDHVDHTTVLSKMAALNADPCTIRWMHSFLSNRQQRVKIGSTVSQWTTLTGGMPQGTWFGPYVFLMLIDDLQPMLDTFKFVDDVTLCEVVADPSISQMQVAARQIVDWSSQNLMNINTKKTKEMLLGSILSNSPPLILLNDSTVERVTSFKLLGLTITNNLNWEEHITNVCNKANKRLHYLKLLKRCSVSVDDLLHYYKSVIRPTIEYACPVWQSGLTNDQRDRLESLQRRALKLISNSYDYELYCVIYDIEPIAVRLDNLARQFFYKICRSTDCINYLLPNKRPLDLLNRLRQPNSLPGILCKTNRFYRSFIPYAIQHYQ
jgi:hypothetical protein